MKICKGGPFCRGRARGGGISSINRLQRWFCAATRVMIAKRREVSPAAKIAFHRLDEAATCIPYLERQFRESFDRE